MTPEETPLKTLILAASLLTLATTASALELTSPELANGKPMNKAQEFNSFGCDGGNLSPALHWNKVPEGTQSFALTVYDPDAPTGSGWWHWVVYDIPANATDLPAGAVAKNPLPVGTKQGRNDFGGRDFGGACPPRGHGVHHYTYKLFALKVKQLPVDENASSALVGYMLNANQIDSAQITATYRRD
jgi:Raf kinase inhibitor-like YbhB/YbcL family protein